MRLDDSMLPSRGDYRVNDERSVVGRRGFREATLASLIGALRLRLSRLASGSPHELLQVSSAAKMQELTVVECTRLVGRDVLDRGRAARSSLVSEHGELSAFAELRHDGSRRVQGLHMPSPPGREGR